MRILGRQLSNWWLILCAILFLICCPLLLIGFFFAANNLAGAIIGPPAIWNRTMHRPPSADLIGRYHETANNVEVRRSQGATLDLRGDATMSLEAFPFEQGTSICFLSGTGTWNVRDDQSIQLHVLVRTAPSSCEKAYDYGPEVDLIRHAAPYRLYFVFGDPDSGTGIWLDRTDLGITHSGQ